MITDYSLIMFRGDNANPIGVFLRNTRVVKEYEGLSALLPMTMEHVRCFFQISMYFQVDMVFPHRKEVKRVPVARYSDTEKNPKNAII